MLGAYILGGSHCLLEPSLDLSYLLGLAILVISQLFECNHHSFCLLVIQTFFTGGDTFSLPCCSDCRDLMPVRRTFLECFYTLAEHFIAECLLEFLGVLLVAYMVPQHMDGILFV